MNDIEYYLLYNVMLYFVYREKTTPYALDYNNPININYETINNLKETIASRYNPNSGLILSISDFGSKKDQYKF